MLDWQCRYGSDCSGEEDNRVQSQFQNFKYRRLRRPNCKTEDVGVKADSALTGFMPYRRLRRSYSIDDTC